jgi:hypothetical protein
MSKFSLELHAYCGMTIPLGTGTLAECRNRAARRIRHHRNRMGYPASILKRGAMWELMTGDDASMVGDGEGILRITKGRAR